MFQLHLPNILMKIIFDIITKFIELLEFERN